MLKNGFSRRTFVLSGLASIASAQSTQTTQSPKISFGIVADLHHGFMPDAHERLRSFLNAASGRSLDFLIQLGDFCHPVPDARHFLRTWHEAPGTKYNVLGNHDMDKGSKVQIMDLLQMKQSYYSLDKGGFHFIVLDCNYLHREGRFEDFNRGNYYIPAEFRDWVNEDQMAWLQADLAATSLPAIVFAHQPIQSQWDLPAPPQRRRVREIFAAELRRRPGGVLASFSGHEHVDDHRQSEGIDYFHMNSASYFWAGEKFGGMAKYKDPLFAFVSIENGIVSIEGKRSEFLTPNPRELNHPQAARVTANIDNRRVALLRAARAA